MNVVSITAIMVAVFVAFDFGLYNLFKENKKSKMY